jgi:hypothetical protein
MRRWRRSLRRPLSAHIYFKVDQGPFTLLNARGAAMQLGNATIQKGSNQLSARPREIAKVPFSGQYCDGMRWLEATLRVPAES